MEQLKQLFAKWAGTPCTECLAIGAGGSARRYFRLFGGGKRCVGAVADDIRENEAFFAYTRHLHAKGMPVPELYAVADDRRHYLQQDLGDQTLYGLLHDKTRQGGDSTPKCWHSTARPSPTSPPYSRPAPTSTSPSPTHVPPSTAAPYSGTSTTSSTISLNSTMSHSTRNSSRTTLTVSSTASSPPTATTSSTATSRDAISWWPINYII